MYVGDNYRNFPVGGIVGSIVVVGSRLGVLLVSIPCRGATPTSHNTPAHPQYLPHTPGTYTPLLPPISVAPSFVSILYILLSLTFS